MNRNEADKLAYKVSGSDIKKMLLNAQKSIKNWEKPSPQNAGLSLGVCFNIFSKIDWENHTNDHLMKKNALINFGGWLPDYEKPPKKENKKIVTTHQPPNFITDDSDDLFNW